MKPYFEHMDDFGKELKAGRVKRAADSLAQLQEAEAEIDAAKKTVEEAGFPTEKINARGWMTVMQRIDYLVDDGSWTPLHSLYNPADNTEGKTNVVDGLAKIEGRWAVVIGFDNKVMAGAWLPGQSENILRVTDLAQRLNIPLVWLVNCSGAKLTEQEKFYANRRGAGTPFYRHAELAQAGVPVLAGIYGTNPAGGGYQSISPTILLAHKDANMAVGGIGIVSGVAARRCGGCRSSLGRTTSGGAWRWRWWGLCGRLACTVRCTTPWLCPTRSRCSATGTSRWSKIPTRR